ncbi:MAG: GntP family transporter [Actinomycetaceae bacterium]|nr:GntP family transporter [Actinomycetaceae bacterium]
MSTAALLGIACGAIALLLILVIWMKLSAFVAIILVSFCTALAAGIPLEDVVPTLQDSLGATMSSVLIIVGLGAMLGRLIERAGGADSLAASFTKTLGQHRVAAAVTAASFVVGIPIFFDVGFIIVAPIVFGFARVAKLNPLTIGLPVAGTLLAVHVALPPHPGPVAAAASTGADNGMMIAIGLPICAVTCIIGYMISKTIKISNIELAPSPSSGGQGGGEGETLADRMSSAASNVKRHLNPTTVILLILLPILLIMLGTVGSMILTEGSTAARFLSMIGASPIALLIGVLVAYVVVGNFMRWNLSERTSVLDSALPDVAVIIFVTAAGGVFAGVLKATGIGDALAETLDDMNMPVILAAYLVAMALRISQGSATVAIQTTGGLMASSIADGNYSSVEVTLITLALAFGAMSFSHINDSGFWIVTKYLGLSVKDGLKTWTVLSTAFSVVGFALTWIVFLIV